MTIHISLASRRHRSVETAQTTPVYYLTAVAPSVARKGHPSTFRLPQQRSRPHHPLIMFSGRRQCSPIGCGRPFPVARWFHSPRSLLPQVCSDVTSVMRHRVRLHDASKIIRVRRQHAWEHNNPVRLAQSELQTLTFLTTAIRALQTFLQQTTTPHALHPLLRPAAVRNVSARQRKLST